MLKLSKALAACQAQNYHKLEYASPTESYYRQGDVVKGEWQGKLAASLGLSGEVSPLEFTRLTEGRNPLTDEQMVRHRERMEYQKADGTTIKAVEHRAGWDATFSAPKSISLTALVGGDERIREAHSAAVTTALTELEKYTHARIGGNYPAEATGKFIAAKFEHDTARPVDGYAAPQLHTHAVIFNVTERADGSTRALQEQPFFDSQQYATAIYQSELMYRLRGLGYQIEAGRSGAPEIKGYTQEYLDASSLRSQQIKEAVEKYGYSGPKAAQIAAHSTREKKQTLTPAEVLAAHKEVAAAHGNQPEHIVWQARERAQTHEHNPDRDARAKQSLTYARDNLFEREAVADERLIFRDALRRGMGETTYAEVRAEFETRREHGHFRSVEAAKYACGRSFTTPETIAAERANVAYVVSGRNAVAPVMSAEHAQEQAKSRPDLNPSQRRAVEEVLNSSDRIHGLQGFAGSGKTRTLAVVREGAEQNGYTVEGFAPTSRAAAELRSAGIDATTLQTFLARGEQPNQPPTKHFYMLDESSLASTRQMRALFDKLKPEDRVLVIGDTRQHQGVDAGRPFEQMQDAGMRTSHLNVIMRQKDHPDLLKAVQHLANNETQKGVALLAEQGRITEIADSQQRIAAIAKDYTAHPQNTIIVSPDNRSRQQINEAVRMELRQNGVLAETGREFGTLSHRGDMTGADRVWAARYAAGDVVQYTTGSKTEGIERGSYATVRSVNARENTLTVEREDGQSVTYDPHRLRGVNVYQEVQREFASGDRLQFSQPNKGLGIANRDLGTVLDLEDGKISVRIDGKAGRTVIVDTAAFRHFDHGYAVTSHSSQGMTTGRVLANFDTESSNSLINSRLAYVAISRASDDARIYTNKADTLGQRIATDISKTSALNFRPPSSTGDVQKAVAAFRSHDPVGGTALLQQRGRIHEYADPEHRLASVAVAYASKDDRAVVVAPDAAERNELTQLIRDELRHQGRLAHEGRAVPVLIEQDFGNPRLAANYAPGDKIHYRAGSPAEHGIADNSNATVLSVDAHANTLTVAMLDSNEVSYNPALARKLTGQSTLFREEQRDVAVGERIRLTQSDQGTHVRCGDFGTVERIGNDNSLSVRLDNGKSIELDSERGRHIDYGYVVEGSPYAAVDRVLVTGDAPQLAQEEKMFAHLSPQTRDLALYISDSRELVTEKTIPGVEVGVARQDAMASSLDNLPKPSARAVPIEELGIGL